MVDEVGIENSIAWNASRATRELTRLYNDTLTPVELNINQLGLLAYLYGVKLDGRPSQRLRALAEFTALHPSIVRRELKWLKERGWIAAVVNGTDQRRRLVSITSKGCAQLRRAVPFWRRAQTRIRGVLGAENAVELNDLLNRTSTKLKK